MSFILPLSAHRSFYFYSHRSPSVLFPLAYVGRGQTEWHQPLPSRVFSMRGGTPCPPGGKRHRGSLLRAHTMGLLLPVCGIQLQQPPQGLLLPPVPFLPPPPPSFMLLGLLWQNFWGQGEGRAIIPPRQSMETAGAGKRPPSLPVSSVWHCLGHCRSLLHF